MTTSFTAPVVLGFPWTFMVIPALVLAGVKPDPQGATAFLTLIAVFVLPPTLNALTILFVGRRRPKPPYRSGEGGETTSRRTPHGPEV